MTNTKPMWEKTPPVETPDPSPAHKGASRFSHPAFGMARISNPQGGDGVFFGSDVRAHHFVSLEITEADMVRNLAASWYFPRGSLIRIDMTKVQWAELVASGGRSGVPVTIRWVRGEGYRPQIDQVRDISIFKREADRELAELRKAVDDLVKTTASALDEAKISKTRQGAILDPIRKVEMAIDSRLPFVETQFREAMEKVILDAKSVISAHAEHERIEASQNMLLISDQGREDA